MNPALQHLQREILVRSRTVALWREAAVPADMLQAATDRLHAAVEQLVMGWLKQSWSAWQPPKSPPSPMPGEPVAFDLAGLVGAPDSPLALAFLDPETLVIAFAGAFVTVRWKDGAILGEVPSRGAELSGVRDGRPIFRGSVDSGSRINVRELARRATQAAYEGMGIEADPAALAAFDEEPEDVAELENRLFSLDLKTGGWRAAASELVRLETDGLTRTPCLVRNDGAVALLFDAEENLEPVLSPDLRYAWGWDWAVQTDDAITRFAIAHADPGAIEGSARAIARGADGRFVVLHRGAVAVDGQRLFELDVAARMACFDDAGKLLAVLDGDDRVHILRVEEQGKVSGMVGVLR